MNIMAARAVLKQHGIDPTSDLETLTAAIEARGWGVSVEPAASRGTSGRPRRWRVLVTLREHRTGVTPYLRTSGPTAENVLVRVLAQTLEREA